MASITLAFPNIPKGADVEVFGLGVFPNGETTEVTEEQAAVFKALNPDAEMPTNLPAAKPEVEVEAKAEVTPTYTFPVIDEDEES